MQMLYHGKVTEGGGGLCIKQLKLAAHFWPKISHHFSSLVHCCHARLRVFKYCGGKTGKQVRPVFGPGGIITNSHL